MLSPGLGSVALARERETDSDPVRRRGKAGSLGAAGTGSALPPVRAPEVVARFSGSGFLFKDGVEVVAVEDP